MPRVSMTECLRTLALSDPHPTPSPNFRTDPPNEPLRPRIHPRHRCFTHEHNQQKKNPHLPHFLSNSTHNSPSPLTMPPSAPPPSLLSTPPSLSHPRNPTSSPPPATTAPLPRKRSALTRPVPRARFAIEREICTARDGRRRTESEKIRSEGPDGRSWKWVSGRLCMGRRLSRADAGVGVGGCD